MRGKHNFFFEFDKAFTHQLIEKFEASPAHPLAEDVAPAEKGVYALYRRRDIVYAGKALDTTLKCRPGSHSRPDVIPAKAGIHGAGSSGNPAGIE